jgi:ABC-type phosphate transport system substrate-binding protein
MPTILSLLASVLLLLAMPTAWAIDRPFAVIAAPGATEGHLAHETVALIYRRKQNYWENGTRIQPVNLPPTHPLRRAFSQSILGHLPEELEDYWREMYFHGVLPPHVLASEEAVILFVRSTPGAIGYISGCVPEHGVNVVLTVGELPTCPR